MRSVKEEAIRTLEVLPEDCTWDDLVRVFQMRADMAAGKPGTARELVVAPYGAPRVDPTIEEEVVVMSRDFDVVIERDTEGFFVASVPALAGCHTQARSLDQLLERVREAIEVCVEAGSAATGVELVGVRRVSVPA